MKDIQVRNRQRDRRVDTCALRSITAALLEDLLRIQSYELGVHLVGNRSMAAMNEQFLQHPGPTDVITFDWREEGTRSAENEVEGEIYICIPVAEEQAKTFQTKWQEEVVRYVVHGVLHLLGYDDLTAPERKKMKREENRLVRELARQFNSRSLGR